MHTKSLECRRDVPNSPFRENMQLDDFTNRLVLVVTGSEYGDAILIRYEGYS
jgi:hypothetical protein